jgi:hypothetical protein
MGPGPVQAPFLESVPGGELSRAAAMVLGRGECARSSPDLPSEFGRFAFENGMGTDAPVPNRDLTATGWPVVRVWDFEVNRRLKHRRWRSRPSASAS